MLRKPSADVNGDFRSTTAGSGDGATNPRNTGRGTLRPMFESRDPTSPSRGSTCCVSCDATSLERLLERCVVCRNHYCLRCAHRHYGKRFCCRDCAEAFFFGDEED